MTKDKQVKNSFPVVTALTGALNFNKLTILGAEEKITEF
jgi:hypothetical protein